MEGRDVLMIILEKISEAIYFALFLIYGKQLKEKRLLFMAIMIFEYLTLKHFIKFNVTFQLVYTFMSFVNLKVLYKQKAQITDIFLFATASLLLILISIICSLPVIITNIVWLYYVMLIVNRLLMFVCLILLKDRINHLYTKFCKNWNRHKNNKIKSLTLRNISVIIFNIMFYVINIYMLYAILTRK